MNHEWITTKRLIKHYMKNFFTMAIGARRLFGATTILILFCLIVYIFKRQQTTVADERIKTNNIFLPRSNDDVDDDSHKQQVLRMEPQPVQDFIATKKGAGNPNLLKYIHFDLKGAPPKIAFYEPFFKFISKLNAGIKGILIEYEDTMPLNGMFNDSINRGGYTHEQIESIQTSAKLYNLEVIPLIQTFGHLEWLLKLQKFEKLRDNPLLPMVISPCLPETYVVLEDLLKQTLNLHPNINTIHIGCDEVSPMNVHPKCRDDNIGNPERYIQHVRRIVNVILKIRPGMRILIWDDVIRSDQFLEKSTLLNDLKGIVEPVSWYYSSQFEDQYSSSPIWSIYSKTFTNVWAASAFKGGWKRFSMITNTTHHVLNNNQWNLFMQDQTFRKDKFYAIILTGWSRFDHFMPICDLFPTAYKSLLSCLYTLNTGNIVDVTNIIDCNTLVSTLGYSNVDCQTLPGTQIWYDVSQLSTLIDRSNEYISFLQTVAPMYNRQYSFVRPTDLQQRLFELQAVLSEYQHMYDSLTQSMSLIYTQDIMQEWLELYYWPPYRAVNQTYQEYQPFTTQTHWPIRPLTK